MPRIIQIVFWIIVFPVMLVAALFLIGTIADSGAARSTQKSICQKSAVTPLEFSQCR